jgi:hypothetical protein
MKRFFAIILALVFAGTYMATIGCGGKSQKINGVAEEESQVMDEGKTSAKESLPSTYKVESGDTLWSIAGKPQIYGNKYQWPLIYDANRDILDDYKKTLEEGQKLIVPRNISAVEIEAAKERAKELGMPPEEGRKTASAKSEEASEDRQDKVAGMGEGTAGGSAVAGSQGGESVAGGETTSEPTPIPEQMRPKKKGKMNTMAMLLILLGVIAVIIFFIFSRQKKKEEEEEEKGEGETKPNILD